VGLASYTLHACPESIEHPFPATWREGGREGGEGRGGREGERGRDKRMHFQRREVHSDRKRREREKERGNAKGGTESDNDGRTPRDRT
jgi:hypothetical protein